MNACPQDGGIIKKVGGNEHQNRSSEGTLGIKIGKEELVEEKKTHIHVKQCSNQDKTKIDITPPISLITEKDCKKVTQQKEGTPENGHTTGKNTQPFGLAKGMPSGR